uniref:SseB family protein n=1 Tax=Acetatifactor sp. TaxID=1872090 RepID=UPI0040569ECC
MEYNKSVSNPMLIGAIELMKAEPTPEHRKMVSDEIVKGIFLSPARVVPVPEAGETKLGPGSQVQLPALAAPNGKQFFMAFTDMSELKKWRDEEGQQTVALSFEEYASMMFKKDAQGNMSPIAGLVINPFSINIVVPKEMVAQYITAKMAQEKGKTTPPNGQK